MNDFMTSVLADGSNLLCHLNIVKSHKHNSCCLLCTNREPKPIFKCSPHLQSIATSSDLELLHSGNNAMRQLILIPTNSMGEEQFRRELTRHLSYHVSSKIALYRQFDVCVIVLDNIHCELESLTTLSKQIVLLTPHKLNMDASNVIQIVYKSRDQTMQFLAHMLMLTHHRMRVKDWDTTYGLLMGGSPERCLFL